MSREIGYVDGEASSHLHLAYDALSEGNVRLEDDVFSNLLASIAKCEKMRSVLGCNDQFKISLLDQYSLTYQLLSAVYCLSVGNAKEALCVLELGRGRALADLISGRYSDSERGLLWDLKSPKVALSRLNRLGQKTPKLSLEDKLPHFNTLKTNMIDYFHNYSVFTGLLIFVSDSTGIIW